MFYRAELDVLGLTFGAFADDPIGSFLSTQGSERYQAWALRHAISATRLRRVVEGAPEDLGAVNFGISEHAAFAQLMNQLRGKP